VCFVTYVVRSIVDRYILGLNICIVIGTMFLPILLDKWGLQKSAFAGRRLVCLAPWRSLNVPAGTDWT
jgi:hypothetical protein